MKKVDKDKLGEKMEELAIKLAEDMKEGREPAKPLIDGFGKLTTYFAATRKLNLKAPDPEEEEQTFGQFRDRITKIDTSAPQ